MLMDHFVIVDHPLFANGLTSLIQNNFGIPVQVTPPDLCELVPRNALILVELFLPDQQCGLKITRRLQRARPDLTPIIWTFQPPALHLWAGIQYKIPGFLDKTMSISSLLYWFNHAITNGAAWPRGLLDQAWAWDQEVSQRLSTLTPNLWSVWAGIVRGDRPADLAEQLGWSQRTLERRLMQLHTALGVQTRSDAIGIAWRWGLIEVQNGVVSWASIVYDLFPVSGEIMPALKQIAIHGTP